MITGGTEFEGFSRKTGLKQDDTVGYFYLDMPSNGVLAASTINYEDVFAADDHQLRDWFRGKAIIVSNFREESDYFDHPDGRRIPGAYAHAVGVLSLLRKVSIKLPRRLETFVLPGVGAIVGFVVAFAMPRRHLMRILILTGCTIVFIVAAVCAYWQWKYLFNPVVPVFALWVVAETGAAVHRVHRRYTQLERKLIL